MDIVEAIKTRKSIRDFMPDPISREIIEKILKISGRAPSAMNTQPWEFIVITGDLLDKIRKRNIELLRSGTPLQPDHPLVGWPQDSVYRKRQVELGMELFRLMEIPREDNEKRAEWMERGFRYFNAPVVIIISVDRMLGEPGPMFDIGAVMQTICLAALNFGIYSCIEDQGIYYPQALREFANIPESKRIMMAIAIGYPNRDFPANRLESSREDVESITTWCGF